MFVVDLSLLLGLTAVLSHGLLNDCRPPKDIQSCYCTKDFDDVIITCRSPDLRFEKEALKDYQIYMFKWNVDTSKGPVATDTLRGMTIHYLYIVYDSRYPFVLGHLPFDGLQNSLKKLTIQGGRNQELFPKIPLVHLENLERLVINFVNIPVVVREWVNLWPVNMKELELGHCAIDELEPRVFVPLTNLRKLGLYNNKIVRFERSMLAEELDDLEDLDLSKNLLTSLDSNLFINMPSLRDVYLHGNRLTSLDWPNWKPVWNGLLGLTMQDNPLECNRDMEWLCNVKTPVKEFTASCSNGYMKGLKPGSPEYCAALNGRK